MAVNNTKKVGGQRSRVEGGGRGIKKVVCDLDKGKYVTWHLN